jgi:hypothetical protein
LIFAPRVQLKIGLEVSKTYAEFAEQGHVTINVDLNTKIIPEGRNVFIARPGKGYRLYQQFFENNLIGPELPGIDLERGKTLSEQSHMDLRMKKTAEVRRWIKDNKPDGRVPVDDIHAYQNAPAPRGAVQFNIMLEAYFETANAGDILIIPPSAFGKQTIVAELTGAPSDIVPFQYPRLYGNFAIPTRRFTPLAYVEKRSLPSRVLDIIAKPNGIVLLGESERDFFYKRAYGSYVRHDNMYARFDVTSEEYSTIDDALILAFFNFVAANTKSITLENTGLSVALLDAMLADLGEYAPSLKTNINSPGSLDLISKSIIPLVASAMLVLAVQVGPDAVSAAEQGMIVLGNSGADPNDPCTALVHESVQTQLQLLGLDNWSRACEIAKRAVEETGLSSSATITEN